MYHTIYIVNNCISFSLHRIAGKNRSVQSPQFTILRTSPGCSYLYPSCILLDLAHPRSQIKKDTGGVSFLTWLRQVCQSTGIRRFMEMSLLNPSIASHGTVEGSRTTWPKREYLPSLANCIYRTVYATNYCMYCTVYSICNLCYTHGIRLSHQLFTL